MPSHLAEESIPEKHTVAAHISKTASSRVSFGARPALAGRAA
jgi:hypothetical protein